MHKKFSGVWIMSYTNGLDKPTDYFNTKLHTGDGGGSGSSTGIGFQPDMVWSKSRTEALNHTLFDSVRGAGSNKELTPNGTSAEGGANSAGFGYISAFNSDGYSWTAGSTNTENFNKSSQTYANWCWKAGTSFTNDASATSIGTIDSAGSVSDTSGFSIVTYTAAGAAATIKHGLSSAPKMIFTRKLNGSPNWGVYYGDPTDYLELNTTAATQDDANMWNDTAPTSSVFSVGGDNKSSGGGNYVAYCFAEKKGYSKFGSYTGNGDADGAFVYTGFKPAFFMLKRTNGTEDWVIYDNKRDPINKAERILRPNATNAESTSFFADILSNGFKLRMASEAKVNGSGDTYIYMAFAESPLVSSSGVPTTAR
jgi:hypothetical protein